MKKSLFVAAIAAISLVACKKGEATNGTNDSIEANADSTQNAIDSTADMQKDSVEAVSDSTKTAMDSTATH